MKTFTSALLFGLFFLASAACSTPKNKEIKTPNELSYSILKTGNLFGAGEENLLEGASVAHNMEEMNSIVLKMNSINEEIKETLIADVHIFDKEMLVFVFDKVRGSGGHTINIKSITETSEEILIHKENVAPNGPASTVMTQPYVILKTKKSTLPVKLKAIEL
jgi:hypothetical protein